MKISELMTTNVITIEPSTPVADICKLILDHHLSGIPVVDGKGLLVGIVTQTDLAVKNANVHFPTFLQILDARIYLSNPRHFEEELRRALGTTAKDVMTTKVATVKADDDISVA